MTRESEAEEKLALVERRSTERDIIFSGPRRRRRFPADAGNREDVPRYPVPYRSSSSLLFLPRLLLSFPPLPLFARPTNSTKHTLLSLLLLFNAWPPLTIYFTSTLEKFRVKWRKIRGNVGFQTEKSKKNEKLFGWWVSGIRTPGHFGGKTRTIAIEPRKHSSIILLFYLYQVTRYIKLDQVRTWIILDKIIISLIAQQFDVIKNIVRNNCYKILSSFLFLLLKDSAVIYQNISSPANFSSKNTRQCLRTD